MSKLTRNPKQYYDKYNEITSKIDSAVECASQQNALKISETTSAEASKLSSISANGDEAVQSLVELVQKIGSQLNTLATVANQYGSEIEPLYEKIQTQLKEMKKQEESYKKECNNGPDNQNDKYYKIVNNEKEFQKNLYDTDVQIWNDKLNNYESLLQSMCDNVDSIINQLSSVDNASITDVASNGFYLKTTNVIPFVNDEMISNIKIENYIVDINQVIDSQYDDISAENIEFLTYTYQTSVGPTTVFYAIIPKDQQPNLAIATDSNGNMTRKLPWKLSEEVGAKVAINFSLFGNGRSKPRDGGAGISYDGTNLFIGKHYNCDTTLYMDNNGKLGYINNSSLKSKDDVSTTLKNKNVQWAAKGFYPIIDEYKYVNNNTDYNIGGDNVRHPRTFIGQLDNGDYIIGACSGRNKNDAGTYEHGMTLKEVGDFIQNYAKDDNGKKVNVRFLMNGDGGGSTAFVVDNKKQNVSGEDRPTTDIIYV